MTDMARESLKVVSEKAILAGVQLPDRPLDADAPFAELEALAATAGAQVVGQLLQKREKPHGRTYLGTGKVQELANLVKLTAATVVIFDHDLSPRQIKALEMQVECKILDRSELILDIFANRATTHAAKLQVEIAQLEYTYPRLRAMWSHLERIVGGAPVGIGTRGPGEKQLEIDRRLVTRRLAQLKRELAAIRGRKQREVQQRNLDHFTVGLVGYTNAGKSTLFNRVTSGGAFSHEKLFATLSTRVERWPLVGGNHVMLSDTVGFIRHLPHHLVASFRSTLEETISAQLIIIVLDVSDPNAAMQLETVQETLEEIGATAPPRLLVLNKTDLLQGGAELIVWLNRHPDALPISAVTGDGIEDLEQAVLRQMLGVLREVTISTPLADSRTIDYLEKRATVRTRRYEGGRAIMTVRIGRRQIDQLLARGAQMRINDLDPRQAIQAEWGTDGRGGAAPAAAAEGGAPAS